MARSFQSADEDYLIQNSYNEISAYPFSMFIWAYPLQTNLNMVIMTLNSSLDNERYHFLYLRNSATVEYVARDGSASQPACTGGSYSQDEWVAIGSTATAKDDRELWVNGVSVDTKTDNLAGSLIIDRYTIGSLLRSTLSTALMNGYTMWSAVWNAALTDAEHASLGGGLCPLLVRPDSLVSFVPLGGLDGDHDNDVIGGYTLTETNSPTWSDDSPTGLIYPSQQIIGVSQGIITPAVQHARLRIGV